MTTVLPRRSLVAALPAFLLAALVVALFAAPAAAANVIELGDDGFHPTSLSVPAGTTVMWRNASGSEQVISGDGEAWDSGPLAPGETFSVQMRQAGTVTYRSDGGATGRITVTAAATTLDAAAPALPRTGSLAATLMTAGVAMTFVLGGALLVRRSQA